MGTKNTVEKDIPQSAAPTLPTTDHNGKSHSSRSANKMPYHILVSTRDMIHEDWLEWRHAGIGGSDASALVGLNPYKSPMSVYADKKGLVTNEVTSEAARQGQDLEQYVAERFMEKTGKRVRRCNAILQSNEHPFMIADVDRLVNGERAGLECKTARTAFKWDAGEVPDYYYVQCQHYLAVTGYDRWYLAVLVFAPEASFHVYEIERNEEDIAALIAAEEAFWTNNMQAGVMPAPDGTEASHAVLKSLYKGDNGAPEAALHGMEDALDRIAEIKELIKELEREQKELEQTIQATMGDAVYGRSQKFRVSWKPVESTRVDSKKLKVEKPDIYEAYSYTSTSRRFLIKEA